MAQEDAFLEEHLDQLLGHDIDDLDDEEFLLSDNDLMNEA